jgi:uncharacterized membrane protein
MDASLPFYLILSWYLFLINIGFNLSVKFSKLEKFTFILALLFGILFIFYGTYLGASTVGSEVVLGLQGRYFIPLLPLFLFVISKGKKFKLAKTTFVLIFLLFLATIFLTHNIINNRYYNFQLAGIVDERCSKYVNDNAIAVKKFTSQLKVENNRNIVGICFFIG